MTLTYRRATGTGVISSASFPGSWDYAWPSAGLLTLTALDTTGTETAFTVNLSGESTWAIELLTPVGLFLGQIEVTA